MYWKAIGNRRGGRKEFVGELKKKGGEGAGILLCRTGDREGEMYGRVMVMAMVLEVVRKEETRTASRFMLASKWVGMSIEWGTQKYVNLCYCQMLDARYVV